MQVKKILNAVEKLHTEAENGQITINKIIYLLTFDGANYQVSRKDGEKMSYPLTWNTRKLKDAKKWTKEWFLS